VKIFSLSLVGATAVGLFAIAPLTAASAQDVDASATVSDHGNWTLKERETWLHDRLDKSKDSGAISHEEFDRVSNELSDIRRDEGMMRDHGDGQLTDNQTTDLEARLDIVADKIHWAHEESFSKPW
jgi:hypothetical protein